MSVSAAQKGKTTSSVSGYGFNFWKFLFYTFKNILALVLGSVASLGVQLIIYTLKLQNLTDFDFTSALQSVGYEWLYDDLFVAILTLGVTLVITYIISFRRESEEYLGDFVKIVDWLAAFCLLLCLLIAILVIVYAWHNDSTNIGELTFYTIIEVISLLVCCFLQSFSHPEYYVSPPQSI